MARFPILGDFELASAPGVAFRDARNLPRKLRGQAGGMVEQGLLALPIETLCASDGLAESIQTILGQTGFEAFKAHEADRTSETEVEGDVRPFYLAAMRQGRVVGAWQWYGIRRIPDRPILVARPMPALAWLQDRPALAARVGWDLVEWFFQNTPIRWLRAPFFIDTDRNEVGDQALEAFNREVDRRTHLQIERQPHPRWPGRFMLSVRP